jgi:hypothetical protein
MSDTKIAEKITDTLSETLTNVLKKSGLSDKLDKIGLSLVFPVVGIILFGIYGFQILSEENTKNRNENIILNSINKDYINQLNSKIERLNEKISILEKNLIEKIDKQQTTLNIISELPLLNIGKEKPISKSSSNASIFIEETSNNSITNIGDEIINDNQNSLQENNQDLIGSTEDLLEQKIVEIVDDDELINECYDSLPLNGVKKFTGIKSFFGY